MFANDICEVNGGQDAEADKAQESFGEFVIASPDSPVALDSLEEVLYSMTTPVELCGEWYTPAVSATRNAGLTPVAAAVCLRVIYLVGGLD